MKFRIKDLSLCPPGGWIYTQPESGLTLRGGDYWNLVAKVRDHRLANNYPLTITLEEEIQDSIGRRLNGNPEIVQAVDKEGFSPRVTTVDDLKNFLLVSLSWAKGGAKFVLPSEASRRAAICLECPYNQKNVPGCMSCKGIVGLLTEVIGGRTTSVDDSLGGCQICGCALKAAVHIPLEDQWAGVSEEMNARFPDPCWKKRQG